MTTPADELRTAADKLRTLAQRVTDGPWRGDDLDEVQSPVGQVARAIGGYGKAPYPNSRYIAVMHPGVGKALADWLEEAARYYEAGIQAADDVFRDDPAGREAFLTTGPGAPSPAALAVARQINGTA